MTPSHQRLRTEKPTRLLKADLHARTDDEPKNDGEFGGRTTGRFCSIGGYEIHVIDTFDVTAQDETRAENH